MAKVLASSMRPLFDYVRARGHDPEELVGHFGMEMSQFGVLRWVPVALTDRLWEHAAELCGDPNIGLHVACSYDAGSGGVVSYLATFSATLGAAIDRFVRYFPLISRTTRFTLEHREDCVRLWCRRDTPCIGRQTEEVSVGVVAHFARLKCGPAFSAAGAGFRSVAPPDRTELVALLGPNLHFQQECAWLDMAPEMLQLPIATGDAQLVALLETAAEKERESTPTDDLSACVRVQLARALAEGRRSGCDDVAQRLGLSARTLRRQLAERGHSYRELREQVLEGVAEELLQDPGVSMDEVAEKLQFSDVRALANATRRWFGVTPQQYRRRMARPSV